MSVSHSSQGNVSDGAAFLMCVAVFVVGVGFGGWYLWEEQHAAISAIVMQGLHGQMRFIHLITDRYDVADAQLLATNPATVKFPQLLRLAREVGRFFLLPSIGVVLALAAVCASRAGAKRFSRPLDLEALMREQLRSFRTPSAFVRRRLGLVDIDPGKPRPADRALTRAEWIERWATDDKGSFIEAAARAELTRQLGSAMRDPAKAPPHVRCILAVFALHRARRQDQAQRYLGDLSSALGLTGKEGRTGPDRALAFPVALVERADQWLGERALRSPLVETISAHGFATTATMSALLAAREQGGVLPPAEFGFLKLVDRRLWYALHSLGFPADMFDPLLHPTPLVEAIGARDHWAAERIAGAPLRVAAIENALAAVRKG
jgi:intracellular multiplication protein IcmP